MSDEMDSCTGRSTCYLLLSTARDLLQVMCMMKRVINPDPSSRYKRRPVVVQNELDQTYFMVSGCLLINVDMTLISLPTYPTLYGQWLFSD